MQMRLDEANEAGGVGGRKFRMVVEDSGSQPQMAAPIGTSCCAQDEVFAIVNPFGSGTNAGVVKRAVDDGRSTSHPGAPRRSSAETANDSPLLFTTTPTTTPR